VAYVRNHVRRGIVP
jgi:DNA polymerase zeta